MSLTATEIALEISRSYLIEELSKEINAKQKSNSGSYQKGFIDGLNIAIQKAKIIVNSEFNPNTHL
jgi:hypothetical protein